jgi:hypothetical protein
MPLLGSHLDFAKLEARNIRIHQLSAAPGSPVEGQLYYDTVAHALYFYNGTAWTAASGGTPPDATTGVKGIVQLAGDLAGTATSPQIAAGAIVDADVNAAAAIQESKLTLATDAAVGTGSRRTLGAGAQQAMPGNRTLDAITAPAADLSMNSHKIINQLDPTNPQDSATKNYVDNTAQGLDAKASVHAATTANIANLATGAPNTLDGVTLAANDRVLVKDQTTQSGNGIYVVTTLGTGANGVWTRATDMDAWTEVPSSYVFVEQGTVNADTGWVVTADAGGTLGTTNITWVQFSSAGTQIAGAGLTKTGNTIDVIAAAAGGITVNPDSVQVDSTVARYYNNAATHGAGTTITITQATHGLRASRALHVQVQDNATGNIELPDIAVAASGDVTVTYAASVSANSKLVTIIG